MGKEIFLREKMYELHLFTVKLLITFSSSALIFSIGMLSLFDKGQVVQGSSTLMLGWVSIIISIVLIVLGLFWGLGLTYDYYNNIAQGKPETDTKTRQKETQIQKFIIFSSVFSAIGIVLILRFAYLNFL